jgi:hypothetical protein
MKFQYIFYFWKQKRNYSREFVKNQQKIPDLQEFIAF